MADVEDDEEEAAAAVGTDLLLAGPETLILARPGDKVEDVDGEEDNEEGDMGGRVFMACPARRKTKTFGVRGKKIHLHPVCPAVGDMKKCCKLSVQTVVTLNVVITLLILLCCVLHAPKCIKLQQSTDTYVII